MDCGLNKTGSGYTWGSGRGPYRTTTRCFFRFRMVLIFPCLWQCLTYSLMNGS